MAEKDYNNFEELLKDIAPDMDPKDLKKQAEIFEKGIVHGIPLKDSLKISPDAIEFIYSQGYRQFMIRKYKEAIPYFNLLYLLNPNDARFSFGLASCYHMQKEFENTVAWYLVSAMVDQKSPLPYYHASDCYLSRGDKEGALYFLYKVLERIGTDEEQYSPLKERTNRMIETLENELATQENKK